MKKKLLIVVASVLGVVFMAAFLYVGVQYRSAKSTVARARFHLRDMDSALKQNNVPTAAVSYGMARLEINQLERHYSVWISSEVRAGLGEELAAYRKEIESRGGFKPPP